jgi:Uma2 family endonuclease
MTTEKKFTYEDYASMPDDGQRYEVINGELHILPTPFPSHQRILGRLLCWVAPCAEESDRDELSSLSPSNVVQPDLMFVARAHASRVQLHAIVGAPDIAIEILGDFTRDRETVATFSDNDTFTSPTFPDLQLPLATIFA